jgi:hypothetical protein
MITNTNQGDTARPRYDIQDLKRQMSGRWDVFLSQYGLTGHVTDGRSHPCPKCGGEDRFNVDKLYASNGTVWCRHCYPKGGDGFQTYQFLTGQTNREAFQAVADFLGVSFGSASRTATSVDVVAMVASAKKIPSRESLVAYGAVRVRGQQKVKVPVYSLVNGQAVETSSFTFGCDGKGLHVRGTHNPGLFLPHGRGPQPGETWCVVEGCKDAAALHYLGFDAVGLPTFTLPVYHVEFFRGVDVIVVPDLDMAGQRGAQKTGGVLHGIASSVRIAKLPGEVVESKGQDVRDILRRPDGASLIRDAIANAGAWVPRDDDDQRGGDDPRPEITIDPHSEYQTNGDVVAALGKLDVFQRVGRLVEVMETTTHRTIKSGSVEVPAGTVSVREIPASILRERIGQAVRLVRPKATPTNDIVMQPTTPPGAMVEAILDRGYYPGVRVLRGVVTVPTLRMDGSVLQVPGYDDVTQLVYQPNDQYPVLGDTATRNQAVEDIEHIRTIVGDFCFESDADFSAWFAMVLTMTCRHLIDGCVPLFAVNANVRGAGKSLLADVANIIAYGRPSARKVYTDDDNEMRKAITSVLLEGIPSVLLDNVDRSFGGASLDAVLTSRTYSDRVLGANRTTGELPADTIWTLTGNNVSYVGDMVRRVLPLRLMSQHERPEDRTDFAQRDLLSYVTAIRAGLVVRVVRVMQAYLLAGRPVQPGGQWGGFSQWYDLIRGCVMWCGLDDPMTTRVTALESDTSTDAVALLHEAIHEAMKDGYTYGVTVSQLILMADMATSDGPRYPAIYEAVAMLCGARPNPKSLGRQISIYKNRWLGERQIVIEKDLHTKTNLIRLRGVDVTSVVEREPF